MLSLERADAVREPLSIAGPPGELYLSFADTGRQCLLELNASEPRRG